MMAKYPSWVAPLSEMAAGVVVRLEVRCPTFVVCWPHYGYGEWPLLVLCELQ